MTDAGLLAEQLEWAATTPAAQNEDYNVVNGDVFRWKWMWQQIADYFGIEAAPFPGEMQPLEGRMLAAEDDWRQIAQNISCASRTLPVWPPGGIPMPIWAARWRYLPISAKPQRRLHRLPLDARSLLRPV